jgi:ABC-type nickel/cobalt efflux system permease component RcnA
MSRARVSLIHSKKKKKRRLFLLNSQMQTVNNYLRFFSFAILIARTFFIILRKWFLSAADKLGITHNLL